MEAFAKKRDTDEDEETAEIAVVDEATEMAKIEVVDETTEATVMAKPSKPTTQSRGKPSKVSYDEVFLQKRGVKTRHCAYIDKDVYQRAAKYARFIGHNGVTVGEYLDQIILNHFEQYEGEIRKRMRRASEY